MASGIGSPTGGQTFTFEEVSSSIIQPLQAQSVVLAAGPQIFHSQGLPLRIPRIDSIAVNDPWRAESTLLAETNPELGEVVLLPSTLKSLKLLHKVSNELVNHAVVNIGDVLGRAFVTALGLTIDKAFLVGDGASNTVKGLANATGVQKMSAVGDLTLDTLHDAVGTALNENARPSAWFVHPRDFTALRKTRSVDGTYLLQADQQEANRYTLLGLPVYVTTQLPTDGGVGTDESTLILADMTQVAVGIDQDFKLTLLDQTFGDYDQIGIRVIGRFDIAPLNPKGVVVLEGVTVPPAWMPPAA